MELVLGALVVGTAGWVVYVAKSVYSNEKARQSALADLQYAAGAGPDGFSELTGALERLDDVVHDWSGMFAETAARVEELVATRQGDGHEAPSGAADAQGSTYGDTPLDLVLASSLTAPLSETAFRTDYRVSFNLLRVVAAKSATRYVEEEEPSLRDLLQLDWRHRAAYVVPFLDPDDPWTTALRATAYRGTRAVAVEDVLATKTTTSALLANWPTQTQEPELVMVDASTGLHALERNVFSFCSVRRNPVTGLLLARDGSPSALRVSLEVGTDDHGEVVQWIDFDGEPLHSPSHRQQREREEAGGDLFDEPVDDFALIARLPNRLDPAGATKAVVIAGLRAFGTWGAAEYLRTRGPELLKRTGGSDFAAVVRVHARAVRTGIEWHYVETPAVEVTEYVAAA
jgi:hypothetical protein